MWNPNFKEIQKVKSLTCKKAGYIKETNYTTKQGILPCKKGNNPYDKRVNVTGTQKIWKNMCPIKSFRIHEISSNQTIGGQIDIQLHLKTLISLSQKN